jgi:hypothetical protein
MFSHLKAYNVNVAQNSAELAERLAELRVAQGGYEAEGLDVPDWVAEKRSSIQLAYDAKLKAENQAQLTRLKAQYEALATPGQKRSKIGAEINRIEKQLKKGS